MRLKIVQAYLNPGCFETGFRAVHGCFCKLGVLFCGCITTPLTTIYAPARQMLAGNSALSSDLRMLISVHAYACVYPHPTSYVSYILYTAPVNANAEQNTRGFQSSKRALICDRAAESTDLLSMEDLKPKDQMNYKLGPYSMYYCNPHVDNKPFEGSFGP